MGYPEDALAPDEELVLHRHPHWKKLVLPAATLLLTSAVAGFLLGVIQARLDGTPAAVSACVVIVAWALIVGWRSVVPFVSWATTHFILTDRRVLVRTGVLTHSGIDIPMGRISNVQFRHGLVDRMLRTGTLVVVSAADDPLEFDDVPEVQQVHALLYEQAFERGNDHSEHRTAVARHDDGSSHRKAW